MPYTYTDPDKVKLTEHFGLVWKLVEDLDKLFQTDTKDEAKYQQHLLKLCQISMEVFEVRDKAKRESAYITHLIKFEQIEMKLLSSLMTASNAFKFINCDINIYLKLLNLRLYIQMIIRSLNANLVFPNYLVRDCGAEDSETLAYRTILFTPLRNIQKLEIEALITAVPPSFRPLATLALAVERHIYDHGSSQKLKEIVRVLQQQVQLTFDDLPDLLFRIFFQSSYRIDEDPDYKMRLYVVRGLRGGGPPPSQHPDLARTLLNSEGLNWLIIHERYSDDHAMNRCWAPYFQRINEKHSLRELLITDTSNSDVASILANDLYLHDMVQDNRIDVIFFPSIGMEKAVVSLACKRYAKIQIAGLGHPGEFPGMEIDLVVGGGAYDIRYNEYANVFTDGVVFAKHPDSARIPTKLTNADQPSVLGIPSKALKLSARFLQCLKRINRQLPNVKIVFFPGEIDGLPMAAASNFLLEQFPSAEIRRMQGYSDYMNRLSTIDLVVNPFPFGNSNGIVDCIKLGVPIVCLEQNAICQSVADSQLIHQVEITGACAKSEGQLESIVYKFFTDSDFRDSYRQQFNRIQYEKNMLFES